MKEYITPHTVANAVRMNRLQFPGSFLIVEGDKDARFYKNYFDLMQCHMEIAFGKNNAIGAIDILEKEFFEGVLAIVDTDFDSLEGNTYSSRNILLTDYHDLEIMLFRSKAFEKILSEFGSVDKIRRFQERKGKDLFTTLLEAGSVVGSLRWISSKQGLCLRFEELSFGKFVDENTLEVDLAQLIKTVKDHSQKPALNESEIRDAIEKILEESHDPLHLCCGHDLASILSIGLRKALGSNNAGDVKSEIVERSLRLAFEEIPFSGSQLYQSIRQWENDNQPFKVLRAFT